MSCHSSHICVLNNPARTSVWQLLDCAFVCVSISPPVRWNRKHKLSQTAVSEENIKCKEPFSARAVRCCGGRSSILETSQWNNREAGQQHSSLPAFQHDITALKCHYASNWKEQPNAHKELFAIFSDSDAVNRCMLIAARLSLVSSPIALMPRDYLPTIRAPPPSCPLGFQLIRVNFPKAPQCVLQGENANVDFLPPS